MQMIPDRTIDLVVTSPPYPMISMWDQIFAEMDPEIRKCLGASIGNEAFELMHQQLDKTWNEVFRVTKEGGFVCINIGDATRTIGGKFQLYPSHVRIAQHFLNLGLEMLPGIIWRKQTNSPNKFMGSGMLPAGAYATLEHEHILIFRKGDRRKFISKNEKVARRESAFFWEERNKWFSDVWDDLKGTRQSMTSNGSRARSGAFPLELPYRLVNMFSIRGDTVLDPFLGTGTASVASIIGCRNSVGFEKDSSLLDLIKQNILNSVGLSNSYANERLVSHREFVSKHVAKGGSFSHYNSSMDVPVKHSSESGMRMYSVAGVMEADEPGTYIANYKEI